MAVRLRSGIGAVDLGDVKGMTEEVVQENEELYDMTFATMIEAFTEPLSAQEVQGILARLDLRTFAAMVKVDPEGARGLLRAARQGEGM